MVTTRLIKNIISITICISCFMFIMSTVNASGGHMSADGGNGSKLYNDTLYENTDRLAVSESTASMPDIMYINGEMHTPNYIPDDVDIDALDVSSPYVIDMCRRFIEGKSSERELDALIKIAERADGIYIDHPKYGYIEIGSYLKMERDSSYIPDYITEGKIDKNSEYYYDLLSHKFHEGTLTNEERLELDRLCEEKGRIIQGKDIYIVYDDVQALMDLVSDYVKVEPKPLEKIPELSYITIDEYDKLKEAEKQYSYDYNLQNTRRIIKNMLAISPNPYISVNCFIYPQMPDEEQEIAIQVLAENGWYLNDKQVFITAEIEELGDNDPNKSRLINGSAYKTGFTEEQMKIENADPDFIAYRVAYYHHLTGEDKKACDAALQKLGFK